MVEDSVPIFDLEDSVVRRPKRISYTPNAGPLIIDNGSHNCRVGWASDQSPCLTFRPVITRTRNKGRGELVTIVGDYPTTGPVAKEYELARAYSRTPFDSNVVYNFELQEVVLDYAFDRLSMDGGRVHHSVMMSEAALNPLFCRSKMCELLFEAYDVPAVHFGVDAAFAYVHNRRRPGVSQDMVVVECGSSSTHVVPMVRGEPRWSACCRMNIGGAAATDHLQRLLSLKYPQHAGVLTSATAQRLKELHCYCATDYLQELRAIQNGGRDTGSQAIAIQLPFQAAAAATVTPEEAAEEAARKAARREQNIARLKQLAAERRQRAVEEKLAVVRKLEKVMEAVDVAQDHRQIDEALFAHGLESVAELERAMDEAQAALVKAKGVKAASATSLESSAQAPREATDGPRLSAADIAQLKDRHQAAANMLIQKAARKQVKEPIVGGRRGSANQRARMKLLAAAADERNMDEGFGLDDNDWDVYKAMDRHGDSEEETQLDIEYRETAAKLREAGQADAIIDLASGKPMVGSKAAATTWAPTAEEYQLHLSVERIRPAELMFQPAALAGVDCGGLAEVILSSLRKLDPQDAGRCAAGGVLLTGGNSMYKGLETRLRNELCAARPMGSPMSVLSSDDPLCDSWKGAAGLSLCSRVWDTALNRQMYQEHGPNIVQQYTDKLQYSMNIR